MYELPEPRTDQNIVELIQAQTIFDRTALLLWVTQAIVDLTRYGARARIKIRKKNTNHPNEKVKYPTDSENFALQC